MARCLYQEWTLADLTCLFFGRCQHHNIYWGCFEVTHNQHTATRSPSPSTIHHPVQVLTELGRTLSNGDTAGGARAQLISCMCDTPGVFIPPPGCTAACSDTSCGCGCGASCAELVEENTAAVLASLAAWLEDNTEAVCSTQSGGPGLMTAPGLLVVAATLLTTRVR